MGQVFTWESVRRGNIPGRTAFAPIARMLQDELKGSGAIVSALLFGSVVRGDFNVRSDIDCVVIYDTDQEDSALALMRDIAAAAGRSYVPINFTPCDTAVARTRLHHLGSSFVRHLQSSIDAGGMIKGSLVDLLAPTIPAAEEIESYIKMKMYSLQESFAEISTFSPERRVAVLKKALEAATHVARKMLIYEDCLEGDSKRQVQARYKERMPALLSGQFDRLLEMDAWYSEALRGQIERPDGELYASALDELEAKTPSILPFLRSNILRIVERTR